MGKENMGEWDGKIGEGQKGRANKVIKKCLLIEVAIMELAETRH